MNKVKKNNINELGNAQSPFHTVSLILIKF